MAGLRGPPLATLRGIRSRAITAAALALGLALAGAGCGGSGAPTTSSSAAAHTHRHAAARHTATSVRVVYRPLFALPAPLRDPATAALGGGRFVLIGGLDSSDVSTSEVDVATLRGVHASTPLALAQHDAQGAALGTKVYVFGGGSASELDHIVSFDPAAGVVHAVGALPHAQSDVAVTSLDGTAYVVGGYDGASWLDTIIAYRPGSGPRVVAHLPVGLRYSSAAAVGSQILIIGGSTPAGATSAIYSFDPATRRVRRIGHLAAPITHAGAAALGSIVYLVGGRGDSLSSQTSAVQAIDPLTGKVHTAGRLPHALSDTGVVGMGSDGSVASGVGELVPRTG
jgi:N-acetylneuraminic acid mutarotase